MGVAFATGLVAGSIAQAGGYQLTFGIAGISTLLCPVFMGILARTGYLSGRQPLAIS